MNSLTKIYTFEEKRQLTEALTKLFSFQGFKKDDKDVVLWVTEIAEWGYGIKHTLGGIRRLYDVNLRILKLSDILEKVKEVVEAASFKEFCNEKEKDYFSTSEYAQNKEKIDFLKTKYGDDWWRHFNDPAVNENWDAIETKGEMQ